LDPPGRGNALRLSGKASYVDAGTPLVLNLTAVYTLMGWMRYSNTAERAAELLYKGGMYWINVNLQSPRAAENHHALAGGFMGPCAVRGERWKRVWSPNVIPTGTWTHLASTYDGQTFSLYINGEMVASKAVTGQVCQRPKNHFVVGASIHNGARNFVKGGIDDVRIFNTPLSEAEIQTYMNMP
jgi:hypothetical protein